MSKQRLIISISKRCCFRYFRISVLFLFILISAKLYAQTEILKDIDGNSYPTIKIGEQVWMAENLRVTRYNNGDSIPFLLSTADWAETDLPAYGYFDNDTSNISKFGLLYNWFTVDDKREVCPQNWHVPSDDEWKQLELTLGMCIQQSERMTAWRGTNEGDKLKLPEFGGNNSTYFSALGTGYRHPSGDYRGLGTDNDYWTSTPYNNNGNREGILHGLLASKSTVVRNFHTPDYGFCIRCVKNTNTTSTLKEVPKTKVYPNPANNKLYVENAAGKTVAIYNMNGQIVCNQNITAPNFETDISILNPGSYVVKVASPVESTDTLLIKL